MRIVAESLRRLFREGKVSEEHVRQMQIDGKITFEELMYILGVKL